MNKKLVVLMVVAFVAVGLVTGCRGKKVGKLSEADFIELNAQLMALTSTEKNLETMTTKMDELFKKYDMTHEELGKISTGPDGDEIRKRLGPKIMKRAQELGFK